MRGAEIIYRGGRRDMGGVHMKKHSYTKTSMSTNCYHTHTARHPLIRQAAPVDMELDRSSAASIYEVKRILVSPRGT